MFDPSLLPRRPGQLLLLTDRLAAPGEFILHNILGHQLKKVKSRCIVVSFSDSLAHWKTVSSRLNPPVILSTYESAESFLFIDAVSECSLFNKERTEALKHLYDRICEPLRDRDTADVPAMIILDSPIVFAWAGLSIASIKSFMRALLVACKKFNAVLVVRHHQTTDDLDDLLRFLIHQCAWRLEILPLSSGRSGVISGEIAVHRGPLLNELDSLESIQRTRAIQYRLSDVGAVYFERGTSAGVL